MPGRPLLRTLVTDVNWKGCGDARVTIGVPRILSGGSLCFFGKVDHIFQLSPSKDRLIDYC